MATGWPERDYLHELLQSGLDHLMIVIDPIDDQAWEGLRDAIAEDIAISVHFTLTQKTVTMSEDVIKRLSEMGIKSVSLSVSDPVLNPSLKSAGELVSRYGMRLIWDLPVPYSSSHPVALELAEGGHC